MPHHRYKKKQNTLLNKLSLIWHHLSRKVQVLPQRAYGWFSALLRSVLPKKRKSASPDPAGAALPTRAVQPISAVGTRSRRSSRRRLLRIKIKNPLRMGIAAGGLALLIVAVVLLSTLTGGKTQQTAVQGTVSSPAAALSTPLPTKLASITVVTPVHESVRIEQGTTATVVSDVQERLMELGYMDPDEPDSIFGTQTAGAVNHFKNQHGLTEDGVVDEETYNLLMSDDAQYYTITVGAKDTDSDNDVTELQQRLVELGYMDKATGYFGTETEDAVKKFQRLNGLSEDGKIGHDTREKLYSGDVVANFFAYGEQSDQILAYQQRLKKLGYLTSEPDGVFGADTREAVRRFQEANGLTADGYIGPTTAAALMSDEAQSSSLSVGCSGSQVSTVQQRLKDLGYFTGRVTGYFGSATDAAVRSFQKRNGLTIDGKVGPRTLAVLMSSSAKRASTTSSGSSSSSGSSGSSSSSSSSAVITGANVESFISVAESKLGCRYVGGGKGPNVFDCSGFVYWCLNQVGVSQSYMTSYTWRSCTRYTRIENMSDLQRGDVIVYYGHVAICAGNGYMIDASSSNGKVVKRIYTGSSYWSRNFICGYRIF